MFLFLPGGSFFFARIRFSWPPSFSLRILGWGKGVRVLENTSSFSRKMDFHKILGFLQHQTKTLWKVDNKTKDDQTFLILIDSSLMKRSILQQEKHLHAYKMTFWCSVLFEMFKQFKHCDKSQNKCFPCQTISIPLSSQFWVWLEMTCLNTILWSVFMVGLKTKSMRRSSENVMVMKGGILFANQGHKWHPKVVSKDVITVKQIDRPVGLKIKKMMARWPNVKSFRY